jgi:hypothetical protein
MISPPVSRRQDPKREFTDLSIRESLSTAPTHRLYRITDCTESPIVPIHELNFFQFAEFTDSLKTNLIQFTEFTDSLNYQFTEFTEFTNSPIVPIHSFLRCRIDGPSSFHGDTKNLLPTALPLNLQPGQALAR